MVYNIDDQEIIEDESVKFKPVVQPPNVFSMNNPNPWYSNPQLPQQSVRWLRNLWTLTTPPSVATIGTTYFDAYRWVLRSYTQQTRDGTNVNTRWWGNNYEVGDYVVHWISLYTAAKKHTSTTRAADLLAKDWTFIGNNMTWRTPAYWPPYSFASLASPLSLGWALTKIVFDTYTTNDWYTAITNGWSITIPQDGNYLLIGLAKFAADINDRHIYIYKNGSNLMDVRQPWDLTSQARDVELTWMALLKKDDIIDIYVEQNSWNSINVTPFLKVNRLWW
jgi:hypothetical protein